MLSSREGAGEQVPTAGWRPPHLFLASAPSNPEALMHRKLSWRVMTSVSALGCQGVLGILKKTELKKKRTRKESAHPGKAQLGWLPVSGCEIC